MILFAAFLYSKSAFCLTYLKGCNAQKVGRQSFFCQSLTCYSAAEKNTLNVIPGTPQPKCKYLILHTTTSYHVSDSLIIILLPTECALGCFCGAHIRLHSTWFSHCVWAHKGNKFCFSAAVLQRRHKGQIIVLQEKHWNNSNMFYIVSFPAANNNKESEPK